jgi:hypothetical protein
LLQAAVALESKIRGIEVQVSQVTPGQSASSPPEAHADPGIVRTLIMRGIGSLYALVLEVTFMPFLVFFMLAGKREVWHGTLQLFPVSRRTQVKETLEDLRDVLRDYLIGMTLVAMMVIAASSLFFWFQGLDYPILTGIVSGLLNMVPYIGAVMAWLPAFMIGLAKWNSVAHFVGLAAVLTAIHIVALNFVAPQLVAVVRLNVVAITGRLFWAGLAGAYFHRFGALRVICDHMESEAYRALAERLKPLALDPIPLSAAAPAVGAGLEGTRMNPRTPFPAQYSAGIRAPTAHARGCKGHQTVASIAENTLRRKRGRCRSSPTTPLTG